MKKLTLISGLIGLVAFGSGCESLQERYNKTGAWTPDGFNYTTAVNHDDFSVDQHWFGFSWTLKQDK